MTYRYRIETRHGESVTIWSVIDTTAPEGDQLAMVRSFSSAQFHYLDVCNYAARLENNEIEPDAVYVKPQHRWENKEETIKRKERERDSTTHSA
jgi:hypothetical protein